MSEEALLDGALQPTLVPVSPATKTAQFLQKDGKPSPASLIRGLQGSVRHPKEQG
jgi:hypothetical protein